MKVKTGFTRVSLTPNAAVFERSRHTSATDIEGCPRSVGGSRGAIKGFSASSVRRLREFLATYAVPDSEVYGFTLTVPWPCDGLGLALAPKFYPKVFKRFRQRFAYRFSSSGFVFRHELQRRKMPHTHAICYLARSEGVSLSSFSSAIRSFWFESCPCRPDSKSAFLRRGVDVDLVGEDGRGLAVMKYLCDHTSKRKQAQLGFRGKQWGVVGRDNFSKVSDCFCEVPNFLFEKVFRQLSRIYRYTTPAPCVFGYKKRKRRKFVKVAFFRPSTVRRVVDYIVSAHNSDLARREEMTNGPWTPVFLSQSSFSF